MLCPQGQNPGFGCTGVLTLKSEQKKVTANMVTLKFGTMPKVTVPDGSPPIPKAQLKINNPSAKQ